jgi:anti-anti-sigma factor
MNAALASLCQRPAKEGRAVFISDKVKYSLGKEKIMLNVTVSQEQGKVPITVIHIQGSVNLGTTPQLDQAIQSAYNSGSRDMLLDMSETSAMTSAGLRSILAAYKLLDADAMSGHKSAIKTPHLKLLGPSKNLREVLHIAGFDAFLDIHENLADAIASF